MRLRKELSASFHPQLLNSVQEICKANHLSAFVPNEIAHEVEVFLRRVKTLVLGLQWNDTTEHIVNLKNRWVHFRIRDVYMPSPQELLDGLYGEQILQGRVLDLSDNGSPDEVFVVVEVDGAANPVIIPAKNILGVIWMIQLCDRFVIPKIRFVNVPRGNRGTLVTARMIGEMIQSGAKDFYVRQKAIEIFRNAGVRPKDRFGEVCALYNWVKQNIRYTRDIFRVELLHSARRMLELRAGDCDDMTILLGAMLVSTGHPVRLILAGFRPHKPHAYSHIYPEVRVGPGWMAIDTTVDKPMGWSPPSLWKRICELGKDGMECRCVSRR